MTDISYGDNVRIHRTPETERLGIADTIGNVYGETTPSESRVEVIGKPLSDYALQVYFDSLKKSFWFAPEMLEYVDHAAGTEVHVHGTPFKSVRQRDGSWKDVPVEQGATGATVMPGAVLADYRSRRRLIAAVLVAVLCVTSILAYRWIRRDITYWSRSVTVEYPGGSLEDCVALAIAGMPGVSVLSPGPPVSLRVPEQEGVIVKATPDPQVARIVVFGHSESVSQLGPASEEPVTKVLEDLKTAILTACSPQMRT